MSAIIIGLLGLLAASTRLNIAMYMSPFVGDVTGFLPGFIHGIIAPVTFVVSLYDDSVTMYDISNSGGWYDFGFILGVGGLFKSSSWRV